MLGRSGKRRQLPARPVSLRAGTARARLGSGDGMSQQEEEGAAPCHPPGAGGAA